MTTISYNKDTDTFHIVSEVLARTVSSDFLYSRIIDQDVLDCARQAIESAGEVIAVPSHSKARGLKPRSAQKYFVQ